MAAIELASTSLFNDANLVSYYKLEDTADSKGANTLTNHNSTTFVAGLFNNAANFNGSTQGLQIVTANPFFSGDTGDIGFSFWTFISTQPSNATMSPHVWGNAVHGLYVQYIDTSGTKTLQITDGNSFTSTITQILVNATWYNICLSYNGTSKTWTWWLNGSQIASGLGGTPAPNISSYSLGYQQVTNSNFLNGRVDDTAVFSRQLSQSDVNIINGISNHFLSPNAKFW